MERVLICVNCTAPVPALVDRHGRLVRCDHCNMVADKYVELETTIIMIDILLIKPEAYRHWIYNEMVIIPWSGIRLAILTTLFHVYITWAYLERDFILNPIHCSLLVSLALRSPFPYVFFLSKLILELALFCFILSYLCFKLLHFLPPENPIGPYGIGSDPCIMGYFNRILEEDSPSISRSPSPSPSPSPPSRPMTRSHSNASFSPPSPPPGFSDLLVKNKGVQDGYFNEITIIISNTVLISGIIKLFPMVMLIWPYDAPVLLTTRLTVSILHIFLLIEALNIMIPNREAMLSFRTIFSWMKYRYATRRRLETHKTKSKYLGLSVDPSNTYKRGRSRNRHLNNQPNETALRQRYQNSSSQLIDITPPLPPTSSPTQAFPLQTNNDDKSSNNNNGSSDVLTLNFKNQLVLPELMVSNENQDAVPITLQNAEPCLSPNTPELASPAPAAFGPPNSYWKVFTVVIVSHVMALTIAHIMIIWVASALWNVTVRDVLVDDWRMLNLVINGIKELWDYAYMSV